MDKHFWADEMVRLWQEGYSLDQARILVRKMMKKEKREELADGSIKAIS
jgi:hypothetical protein